MTQNTITLQSIPSEVATADTLAVYPDSLQTAGTLDLTPGGALGNTLGGTLEGALGGTPGGALGGMPGGTLGGMPGGTLGDTLGDTLRATAAEIFGNCSEFVAGTGAMPFHPPVSGLIDSIVFKLSVLACFAVYCLVIYYYRQQVISAINVFRSKLYVEKLLDERNYTFENMLNIAVALGAVALSLAAIKAVDIYGGGNLAGDIPQWGSELLVPAVLLFVGAAALYQILVLLIAGALTYSGRFISRLRYLRKVVFCVCSLILTPTLLMFSLAGGNGSTILLVLLVIQLLVLIFFHLGRTCVLFVDENISKLYWFLYLCAVEIFPVTFLVLLLQKNFF